MRKFILLFILFSLSSCINNDIPYPVIKGNVLKFDVSGQSQSVIDEQNRVVRITLGEESDISRVELIDFEMTPGATTDLDTLHPMNLSKKIDFTIHTFQDYRWRVEATQPIERYFQIENQVGATNIDVLNKKIIVFVESNQQLSRINVLRSKLGPTNAVTLPEPIKTTNFVRPQIFLVKYLNVVEEWTIYVFLEE